MSSGRAIPISFGRPGERGIPVLQLSSAEIAAVAETAAVGEQVQGLFTVIR